jgi:hypothetical protein
MASGLLPKSPVSSSLCDEVPHIFIPKSHLEPREFLISSAKRLLQQYLPLATDAPQQTASLFDHLVGDGEHPWRHLDAERSRRLKVDDELEFSCLHHRQLRWLRALENVAGIDADLFSR